MAKKIALLFSGQGAQLVGMGKDLAQRHAAAANVFGQTDALLGRALSHLAFEGPLSELTQTANCQPALYAHGLAVLRVLQDELGDFPVAACAGLSLGEFTAHAAAQTFSFETGLRLVVLRSQAMEAACRQAHGSMAAFVGGEEASVRELAARTGVDVANFNAPGQIVLSGEQAKVEAAVALAKEYGVRRAVMLTVDGAFHSRLMASAEAKLRPALGAEQVQAPRTPVIANVTARPVETAEAVRETLARQITGSVRWTESIQFLLDEVGCDLLLELGPGEILAGLVKRIRKEVEVLSIGDAYNLEAALPRLRAAGVGPARDG
ncbi:MAG: ACP S-malonyltransferase [Verrucomicrobia bacterium]|nr:ACP S-malonyltransferase [Verrucomicrobiota bacterium]